MDERAFEAFVVARTPALLRTAYLLCGDQQHAEDLVQSALAKTAARLRRLREPGAVEAYVRRTIYHEQVSRWRLRSSSEVVGLPVVEPRAGRGHGRLTAGTVADATAADHSDHAEARLVVGEALRTLAPGHRAVLVLRYFDDLTERETAAVLGCSIGTVKSQTRAALRRLVERAPGLAALAGHGGRSDRFVTTTETTGETA